METYSLSEPANTPENQTLPETPADAAISPLKKYGKGILIVFVIVGFISMFVLGSMLNSGPRQQPEISDIVSPTPTIEIVQQKPNPSGVPSEINASLQYLPGKQFVDDSVAIVTMDEPKRALLLSISRLEQAKNFTQYVKVNSYDGTNWTRETITTTSPDAKIVTNPLISGWSIVPEKQTTGKNQLSLQVSLANKPVTFTISKLSADISQRTAPGLTKFNYFGEGVLQVDGESANAYIFYSQTYASSASDMAYLSKPEKMESTWLVFWDKEGNAYYYDSLSSPFSTSKVQNYQFSSIYSPMGTSIEPLSSSLNKIAQTGQYTATFAVDKKTTLQFALTALLNKSPVKTYSWQTGIASGNVTVDQVSTDGVGLFETIGKTN